MSADPTWREGLWRKLAPLNLIPVIGPMRYDDIDLVKTAIKNLIDEFLSVVPDPHNVAIIHARAVLHLLDPIELRSDEMMVWVCKFCHNKNELNRPNCAVCHTVRKA
jgi:hypothetical protein